MAADSVAKRYRVIERLATGGMAEVFLAETTGLADFQKTVALKRVLPHLAKNPAFVAMFLDEARLSARLSHKNIVHVFDVGQVEDTYFIVMEYVDGAPLKAIQDFYAEGGGRLPIPVVVQIGIEVSSGLHYAHRVKDREGRPLGIVHRDVSPANILVSRSGGVKLVDFGLAKAGSHVEQTAPGVFKGKFGYTAPDVLQGADADAQADVYSLGVVLWETLAGRPLYRGKDALATYRLVREGNVPPLREINPEVPDALVSVLARAIAGDKSVRYATAADLGRALTEFLFAHQTPVTSEDVAALVRTVRGDTAVHGVVLPPPEVSLDAEEPTDPTRRSVFRARSGSFAPIAPAAPPANPTPIVPNDESPEPALLPAPAPAPVSMPAPASVPAPLPAPALPAAPIAAPPPRARRILPFAVGAAILGAAALVAVLVSRPGSRPPRETPALPTAPVPLPSPPTSLPSPPTSLPSPTDPQGPRAVPAPMGPAPERPTLRARTEITRALTADIDACGARHGRFGRHVRLRVVYEGATGRAVDVAIVGTFFTGTPVAACIEQAVRARPLPRFRAARWETDYSFMLR